MAEAESRVTNQLQLLQHEIDALEKRRNSVRNYDPPVWSSNLQDDVSGARIQRKMVEHANIVFIGPVGSGKSSLIGSLYRAVNEAAEFPEKVQQVLHHPDTDSHGTVHWLETRGNSRGTIVFQDTRGDQEYDSAERTIHEKSLQGLYRDQALLQSSSIFSRDWWSSQRYFWERSLSEVPHSVVFVFDGSRDPFMESESESLEFFRNVFEDCTKMGYEPVIVITCLDLIYSEAIRTNENYGIQVQHRREKVLSAFEGLNLTRQMIYFVTNFHEGRRGGVKVWTSKDSGFDKTTKVMVDLAMDLLSLANRFIERKYSNRSGCCVL